MGQSNSSQSRSSRRQASAAATSSSSRTRSLRPSTATPGSHLPSPPSSSSSSPSRSPPLPPLPPTTLITTANNINGSSIASAATATAFLAPSSPPPPPTTTTHTSTSGTMTSTIPRAYSHSLLHQHQHQHPNHIHSAHSHHHSLQQQQQQQQQQQPQQQQQRPLGTSNTLPANSSSPIWHDHHLTVPVSTTATTTTSTTATVTAAAATATAITGASPSSSSATAPSRVLRSTTRRRRLLSAFYPLLSRNSSNRGDATATPSSPGSAEPSTSHTQSQSHGQSNRLNNNSSSTPNAIPETRLPRHRQPDRPLSRNGLQPTQSTSRSSRGRSRVQRRYDEQSIRSLRSTSSRSSSVLTSPPPASSAAYATGASAAASMSAAAPSLVPPTSMMSTHSSIYHPQIEPMELDHGVHTPTPFPHHYQQHQHQYHYQQQIHLQQQQQLQQQQHMSLDPPMTPAHLVPVDHATPTRMTVARSRTDDSVFSGRSAGGPAEASLGSRPDASHTSSSRPDSNHVRFGGLFVGLSNPRGGTSISSSLMPIQPNSEDEDEYGHNGEDDRSQRRASSLYHHLDLGSPANDNEQQQQQGAGSRAPAGDSRRPRPPRASRYPPPDIVADLIQGQFEQALAESAAAASAASTIPSDTTLATSATLPSVTTATPSWTQSIQQQQQQQHQHQQAAPSEHLTTLPRPNSSSTSLETVNNSTAAGESHRDGGSTSTGSSMSETPSDSALGEDLFGRRSTRVHRRRLRSSSLRGLLGFQPMTNAMAEERLTGNSTVESEALPDQRNGSTHGPDGNMDRPRLIEMRFFARLMAEFGRGLRGHGTQSSESGGDRMAGASATAATSSTGFTTEPSLPLNSATNGMPDSTGTQTATSTAMPLSTAMEITPMTDATSSPLRESTTEPSLPVRPRRHTTIRFIQIGEGGRFDLGGGRRSRSRSTGAGQGSLRGDSPEGTTGLAREDLADAIIMLLSNASTAAGLEGESFDNAPDGPEGSRPGRSRRSPWLVLTLSGAFLGSLLAGSGAEGEESGMSYDDLWALSNLIGPARPTTTTQEAIDNAGFHVGQFDDASKGMRGFHTLGDGSKCLVCMSDYEEGEDMRALSCKHGFHQECIDKWLTTGANKCPVCRAAAVVSLEPAAAAGRPLTSEE